MKRRFSEDNDEQTTSVLRRELANGYYQTYLTGVSYKRDSFIDGWNIPNFHKRVGAGELLPHTPYTRYFWESNLSLTKDFVFSSGNWDKYQKWGIADNMAYHYDRDTVESLVSDIDLDYHVQAAAAALYGSGHDTLTFLAEFRSVIRMFTSIGSTLIDLATKPSKIGDNWLQFRYGWRTLYYDLMQLQEVIENIDKEFDIRSKRSGTTSLKDTQTLYTTWTNPTEYETKVWFHDKVKVSLRGAVSARIDAPNFQFNVVQTAWELVKYSFIIDWFINIGQWIASNSFLLFSTEYAASNGRFVEIERSIHTDNTLYGSCTGNGFTFNGVHTVRYLHRTPSSVSLLPQVNVRLDVSKVLDLLAIAKQLLR